jgi:hypothetical protein
MDHLHDRSYKLIAQAYKAGVLPEYVRECKVAADNSPKNMPSHQFACREQNLFPVHTRADTLLSLLYFHKNAASVPGRFLTEAMLQKAASLWNIPKEEQDRVKDFAESLNRPVAPKAFLTMKTSAAVASIPVTDSEDVRTLVEEFRKHSGDYTPELVQKTAEQLCGLVQDFDVRLSGKETAELEKAAGLAVYDTEKTASELERFADCCEFMKVPEYADSIRSVAGTVREKFASVIPGPVFSRLQQFVKDIDSDTGVKTWMRQHNSSPDLQVPVFTKSAMSSFTDRVVYLQDCPISLMDVTESFPLLQKFAEDVHGRSIDSPESCLRWLGTLPATQQKRIPALLGR